MFICAMLFKKNILLVFLRFKARFAGEIEGKEAFVC